MRTAEFPIVSVCLITYNHSNYIRQAIDGVLKQEHDYPWEIIIADDFSKDGTRDILREYQTRYPDLIRLILQEKNVGPAQNWLDLVTGAKGQYIAYFEGDDYWTDQKKLQKQAGLLEANAGVAACFHDVIVVDDSGNLLKENYYIAEKEIFTQEDSLVTGGAYCTSSVMFRSSVLKNMPEWFRVDPSDYMLDLLITEFGTIAHIGQTMGAYRIHGGGVWQGNSKAVNFELVIERYMICLRNPKFKKEYGNFFYNNIAQYGQVLARHYQHEQSFFKKLKYAWYYFYYSRPKKKSTFSFLIGTLLFPVLSNKMKMSFSKKRP